MFVCLFLSTPRMSTLRLSAWTQLTSYVMMLLCTTAKMWLYFILRSRPAALCVGPHTESLIVLAWTSRLDVMGYIMFVFLTRVPELQLFGVFPALILLKALSLLHLHLCLSRSTSILQSTPGNRSVGAGLLLVVSEDSRSLSGSSVGSPLDSRAKQVGQHRGGWPWKVSLMSPNKRSRVFREWEFLFWRSCWYLQTRREEYF